MTTLCVACEAETTRTVGSRFAPILFVCDEECEQQFLRYFTSDARLRWITEKRSGVHA